MMMKSLSKTTSFRALNYDPAPKEESSPSAKGQKSIVAAVEGIRVEVKKFRLSSTIGMIYDNILLVISVLSCFQFIASTYLEPSQTKELYYFSIIEEFVAVVFMFDWCLSFFIADHKLRHFLSFFSMIDLLTVIPIWATMGQTVPVFTEIVTAREGILYFLFGLSTTRILRALRVRTKLAHIDDAVDQCVAEIVTTISIMILFNSALMQFLEKHTQPHAFHTWMYYIWVTISTVGYGDISPHSPLGRFFAMAMIGFAIVFVPNMTNKLMELTKLQSIYARLSYSPKGKHSKHVVICGDLRSASMEEFFDELFHEDHENVDLNAVVLQTGPPTLEMLLMLRDPILSLYLTYVEGSALIDKDLSRAHAGTAVAIFIMANKFVGDADAEDAKTILQQLSIKRFTQASFLPPKQLYCLQLIRPENQRHLSTIRSDEPDDNVVIVCFNEIKMGVLAKATMFPGTNTLIMNLISSFADVDEEEEDDEVKDKKLLTSIASRRGSAFSLKGEEEPSSLNEQKSKKQKEDWLSEYQAGCDYEIYTTPLSEIFGGVRFVDLAFVIYRRLGVVMFALQIEDIRVEKKKTLLNPAFFVIPYANSEYNVTAFVIAKNKADSNLFDVSAQDETFFRAALSSSRTTEVPVTRKPTLTAVAKTAAAELLKQVESISPTKQGMQNPAGSRVGSTVNAGSVADDGSKKPPIRRNLWKTLRRSSLLHKKLDLDSIQEKLQKMEENHVQQNYYVSPIPLSLDSCFIKTSVVDEIPHINNHLIVMGKDLSNLYDLIKPLRAKYLGSLKYIVILHPHDIPDTVWRRICYFEAILIVRGSSLEESDIRRAGIFRAHQVVVLADSEQRDDADAERKASAIETESLVDSDAIFTYQCVKRLNPQAQVVVEIVHHSNIAYLEAATTSSKEEYKFSPQFASGTLFTTSLLDSLVCQAFYTPQIIKIVNRLISGVDQLDRNELISKLTTQAESSNLAEKANEDDDEDVEEASASTLSDVKSSALYLISIPDTLTKKTYGALFKHLARENMIPLGLLRGTFTHMALGPKANKMPYVYTNPDRDSEVFVCDRVFVLSTVPMQANKLAVKDWIMDIQMHKKLVEQRIGVSNDVQGTVANIHKEFNQFKKSQKKLDAKFCRMSTQMNRKFDIVMNVITKGAVERTVEEEEILKNANVNFRRSTAVAGTRLGAEHEFVAKTILDEWKQQVSVVKEETKPTQPPPTTSAGAALPPKRKHESALGKLMENQRRQSLSVNALFPNIPPELLEAAVSPGARKTLIAKNGNNSGTKPQPPLDSKLSPAFSPQQDETSHLLSPIDSPMDLFDNNDEGSDSS